MFLFVSKLPPTYTAQQLLKLFQKRYPSVYKAEILKRNGEGGGGGGGGREGGGREGGGREGGGRGERRREGEGGSETEEEEEEEEEADGEEEVEGNVVVIRGAWWPGRGEEGGREGGRER